MQIDMKKIIALFTMFLIFETKAQVLNIYGHPSTWSNPNSLTIEERKKIGYNEEKLLEYSKWRLNWKYENLSPLFILFDQKQELPQYYEWDGGRNYVFKYHSTALDSGQYLEYRVEDRPKKGKNTSIKEIPIDSLNKIDLKDSKWISNRIKEADPSLSCLTLNRIAKKIYIVKVDTANQTAYIMKTDQCFSDMPYADDLTDYKVESIGDSLIIIHFDDNDN